MKFLHSNSSEPVSGELIYRAKEYSIDFISASKVALAALIGGHGNTSVALGTLQLEIGIETGIVLYPWGLFAATRWRMGSLKAPDARMGRLLVDPGLHLKPGVAVGFTAADAWVSIFDKSLGWIYHGLDGVDYGETRIEFAENVVAGLRGESLVSLWLKPTFA